MFTIFSDVHIHAFSRFLSISAPFWDPLWLPGRALGSQRGARTTPKAKKGAKERGARTGLEKGLCLEGAKPRKVSTLIHFQLFFRRPQAPKKEPKLEPKESPNRTNLIQEHPWACFWPLVGSIFELVFSTLIFNAVQVQNGTPPPPKWATCGKGGTSGSVGILHFSLLEVVIMWVLARFSKCRLCAAP